MYVRPIYHILKKRVAERRKFIQVLSGPRQTGKTTIARRLIDELDIPSHYASADEPALKGTAWIEQQWETARFQSAKNPAVLILDEIHKIPGWSETIKRLWDEDTAGGHFLHVVLLGSAPLLIQSGLTESLAGRFEIIPVPHWSFPEMRDAFGWSIDQYICYGGYPGAADLIADTSEGDGFERWRRYIMDALVEMTVSRDILLMKRIDKPALLRRLFDLGCAYSGQILSYQKMLGQLQDAGNTTTLAHYLDLLDAAGLIKGLQKISVEKVRQRASSPKLIVLNTALMTAATNRNLQTAKTEPDYWGHLVESAVGAALVNNLKYSSAEVCYWLGNNREVDFVVKDKDRLIAIEVKSGGKKAALPGMEEFAKHHPECRKLLVGAQGISIEQFLSQTTSIIGT
jgi:predicted AAA+ superfamily ATPase